VGGARGTSRSATGFTLDGTGTGSAAAAGTAGTGPSRRPSVVPAWQPAPTVAATAPVKTGYTIEAIRAGKRTVETIE
jgi:hypothetical protein